MKSFIVILMSPLMAFFLMAAIQTIEYNTDNGTCVPVLAYLLLLVVAIWCFIAVKISSGDASRAMDKLEIWFDNFLKK
ncbi:MAG: hypothetical protein LLG05_01410 [Porphyromonadaceae bacterium]|nr:hypothetical protein [Porphyromonadaceae bacterium]